MVTDQKFFCFQRDGLQPAWQASTLSKKPEFQIFWTHSILPCKCSSIYFKLLYKQAHIAFILQGSSDPTKYFHRFYCEDTRSLARVVGYQTPLQLTVFRVATCRWGASGPGVLVQAKPTIFLRWYELFKELVIIFRSIVWTAIIYNNHPLI